MRSPDNSTTTWQKKCAATIADAVNNLAEAVGEHAAVTLPPAAAQALELAGNQAGAEPLQQRA